MSTPAPFIAGASSPIPPMTPAEARAYEERVRRERDQQENLYSLAVELKTPHGWRPELIAFHAADAADARAHLVRLVSTGAFPKRSRIVAHGLTIGVLHDESGKSIIV